MNARPAVTNPATLPPALRACLLAVPLIIVIALLFHEVLGYLWVEYSRNPELSYGIFVIPLAGWAVYQRFAELSVTPPVSDSWGLAVILVACAMFLFGTLSAELYSSRFSLILLIAGLIWTFFGLAWLRILAIPFLILLTIVPLPLSVYNLTASGLSSLLSATVALVQQLGVAAYRDNGLIETGRGSLEDARASSGLRALPTLLAVILSLHGRMTSRIFLVAATAVFSVLFIGLRTALVLLWMDRVQEGTSLPAWPFSGWLICAAGLLFLAVIRRIGSRSAPAKP